MTNLFEKSLLTGFGIFSIIIFMSFILPFFNQITSFNEKERNVINKYQLFINEIDNAILFVIQYPSEVYIKSLEYPEKLNITFQDNFVKFNFIIDNKICYKILEYSKQFYQSSYKNLLSGIYELNVSYISSLINVIFN